MIRLMPIFERAIASGYMVYLDKYIELKGFTGIVYYYASWCAFSECNLAFLFQSASYNPQIPVCVFELDEEFCKSDLHWEIGRGTGWGDIFWFKDGALIGKMDGGGLLKRGTREIECMDEMNRSYE